MKLWEELFDSMRKDDIVNVNVNVEACMPQAQFHGIATVKKGEDSHGRVRVRVTDGLHSPYVACAQDDTVAVGSVGIDAANWFDWSSNWPRQSLDQVGRWDTRHHLVDFDAWMAWK